MKDIAVDLRYAYHAEVAPQMLDLRVRHPFFSWWWFDRGAGSVRSATREDRIEAGQWMLFPPHYERRHRIDRHTVLISISFEAVWATGTPLLDMPGPLVVDGGNDTELRRMARSVCRAREAFQPRQDIPTRTTRLNSLAACRLHGRLLVFVAALFDRATALGCSLNAPTSGDERLDWVLRDMRSRLSAGPLPWSEWSGHVGLGRSQLDRLCRQTHGVSLRQRRDQLLLDELRQRLWAGRDSIKEIAASLGFVDTAHFCRWTRHHTGRSPRELRREAMA